MTVVDEATMSEEYRARIKENRMYYASKQGAYRQAVLDALKVDCRFKQVMLPSFQTSASMILVILQGVGLWCRAFATP